MSYPRSGSLSLSQARQLAIHNWITIVSQHPPWCPPSMSSQSSSAHSILSDNKDEAPLPGAVKYAVVDQRPAKRARAASDLSPVAGTLTMPSIP